LMKYPLFFFLIPFPIEWFFLFLIYQSIHPILFLVGPSHPWKSFNIIWISNLNSRMAPKLGWMNVFKVKNNMEPRR
jgi:hypothetical protein